MLSELEAKNVVSSGVAAVVLGSGALAMSLFLAARQSRSPSHVALSGGLALASAVFALLTGRAAYLSNGEPAALSPVALGEVRAALDEIRRAAQAGATGHGEAAQRALAAVVRRVSECEALLDEG